MFLRIFQCRKCSPDHPCLLQIWYEHQEYPTYIHNLPDKCPGYGKSDWKEVK